MLHRIKTAPLLMGALAMTCGAMIPATPAAAQDRSEWQNRDWQNRDRDRDRRGDWDRRDRDRDRWQDSRRDRERERRKDAKTDGIVTGVVATAVIGGIIAAAASSGKKKSDRQRYCEDRYGNYDPRTDQYRASDGRYYRCD